MKQALLILLAAGLIGCKKDEPPPTTPVPQAAELSLLPAEGAPSLIGLLPGEAGLDPAVQPTSDPLTPAELATLGNLNFMLRDFRNAELRFPTNLTELIAGGYLNDAPEPPSGKRFVLDQSTFRIVVVDK